jgi:SAM-dependent methyltransferase
MLVSPIEGYRLWAPGYDDWPNPLLALEGRILSGLLGSMTAKQVVDVACGTGRWMLQLRQLGAVVIGLDISADMLAQAQRKPSLRGHLIRADVSDLPLPIATSDVTLCSFAASYFPNLNLAMSEMARVTKAGGRIVISDVHPAAVSAGWTRSFRVGESVFEIETQAYSNEQFAAAARRAGLQLVALVDAPLGEPERPMFRASGKDAFFAQAASISAIRISVWSRP